MLMYQNDTGIVSVFDTKQVQMQYISRICTSKIQLWYLIFGTDIQFGTECTHK